MKRRNIIRICSFAFCAVAALAAFAIIGNINSSNYKARLEASYQRNLMQLSECLDSIETNLSKCQYVTSSEMMNQISSDLYTECCTAKNALSALPISQLNLTGAYKFLSQAGDYARYLSTKDEITQEEYDNLAQLLTYAEEYSDFADTMVSRCNAGGSITDNEITLDDSDLKVSSLSVDFSSAEETFEDYPTLLYDGPFADAVLNKESELINNAETKDQEECREIAAQALGVEEGGVVYKTEESGTLPAYVFSYKLYTIAVTKSGGYISYILNEGTPSEQSITEENAINIAKSYLSEIGYSDMVESYYTVYNNVCTINFAYSKDNIIYYSDLIKVGVSLADGSIFSLEADGYLVNHTERDVAAFSADADEIQFSDNVEILSVSKCLIPKSSGVEVFCYEYLCRNKSTGQEVLIYTDSETGEEEEILLLMYSDNGTLTK